MASPVQRALEAGILGVVVLTVYYALTTPTVLCLAALAVLWGVYRRERRRAAGTIPLTGKHVLITGCDSGIGHALAKHLHQLGCHVIATVLNLESKGAKELRDVTSPKMTVLPMDVGSDDSVSKCLHAVNGLCSNTGLWGLVNNAAINFIGEVELTTMRQYLNIANVNVFGMVRTTRAFLPLIRQAKGRIVYVSSVKGQISTPLNAAYNIAKYGVETFGDIVRLEMSQFGVKVVVIEPGNFGKITGCLNPDGLKRMKGDFDEMWAEASDEVRQIFTREHLDNVLQAAADEGGLSSPTLTPVLDTMTVALTSGDPEPRYIVGGSNQLLDKCCTLVRIKPFLSDRMFDRLVSYCYPAPTHRCDTQ